MRYHVLSTDYDGTLACNSEVSETTLSALQRFVASGRRLILVTGRELPQLKAVFPGLNLFHWGVAENGGLLPPEASSSRQFNVNTPLPRRLCSQCRVQVDRGLNSGLFHQKNLHTVAVWQRTHDLSGG